MARSLLKFNMHSISIKEPVKIRLRSYKTLFRRALPLENYEKGILGLIHENNGEYDYNELGSVLGFAMQDNLPKGIRKDIAEVQIFEYYLENLKSNHLIQYNNQSVQLTFWGEKAISDQLKYLFYSGSIKVPEFFDILLSEKATNFTFKEIGVEVRLTDEILYNDAWNLEKLDLPDEDIVNQFHQNRFNKNDEVLFDSIEPTSNIELTETELEFSQLGSNINVLYKGDLHEQLSIEINQEINNLKTDGLKLKLSYLRLIESKQQFSIEDLKNYASIVDWSEILENQNIIWSKSSIALLDSFQVNWKIISSKCPKDVIQQSLESYKDYFDWFELTNRFEIDFILSNIDKYPWDTDAIIDRITLDEFKEHTSDIVKLEGIELEEFYKKIDSEFIAKNFNKLPKIEDFISTQATDLCEYLETFPNANWNKSLVSQNIVIQDLELNYNVLKHNLNLEIVLERVIFDSNNYDDDFFRDILSETKFTRDDKILNQFTKCNLNLSKLEDLDDQNLIYWGNKYTPGFEGNPFQSWTVSIIKAFESRWNYEEAIEFLGGNISDSEILKNINFNWDFSAISKNSSLINSENFLEEFKDQIDVNTAVLLLEKNNLKSYLQILSQLNQVSKIISLPDAISKEFSLEEVIETKEGFSGFYIEISSEIDWRKIWLKTSKAFIKKHIEEVFSLIESISVLNVLLTDITNCFEIDEIFNLLKFDWDWNIVTERSVEEGLVDSESLIEYADLWDWKVLIEQYFEPEDLQIEGRLSEIAALISQASDEVSQNSWRIITEIYPSHSLWKAINGTRNIDLFKWDWDYISSSKKISLDLNTLKEYKEDLNWALLSSNSFVNGFFKNDREIYKNRKQWENHVLSYLTEFSDSWDFIKLSKLDNITRSEAVVNYFRFKWDWDVLSSASSKLLTNKNKEGVVYNTRILEKFEQFINFEIISERIDAIIDFDLLQRFDDKNWDWKILSSNERIKINKEILLNELIGKSWDWSVLCKNPVIEFSNRDLILLKDKDLDWKHFSSKEWVANSTIVELAEKEWDWYAISNSSTLIFDDKLLQIIGKQEAVNWNNILRSKHLHCNDKTLAIIALSINSAPQYWQTLSRNQNLIFENQILIDRYNEFWDWNTLIENNKIDINSLSFLKKYQDFINWTTLSSASHFVPELSILKEFKHILNWKHITRKISLNEEIIDTFKSYIDWAVLCRYSDFSGQIVLIKRFADFIDFAALEQNSTIDYETSLYIEKYLSENIHKRFVYELKKQRSKWSGYVYHFTHLTNAIEIIKNRQIASRNQAIKISKFSDAAGSVVNRRHDAHDYARFYFRPQTPTQFYNECLGKDYMSDKFSQAQNLGLPKCPIPIFFKFSIDEIFNNQSDKCFISNGNLQTNWARIGSVREMFNKFDFDDIYSTIQTTSDGDWRTYINKSQQEFLVKDMFDFSDIHNYEILVRNSSDLLQLKHHLRDYPEIIQKTRIADYEDNIYLNDNKSIDYEIEGNSVSISSDYGGNGVRDGYFEMEVQDGTYKINSGQVLSKTGNTIRFYPRINIEFEREPCLKVTFKDQATNKEPWKIIQYCNEIRNTFITHSADMDEYKDSLLYPQSIEVLCKISPQLIDIYDSKVRHYVLRHHTNLVLNQFDEYFHAQFNDSERAFFRFFLLVHDIGKPQAFKKGNKDNQYVHSLKIIEEIWGKISNSEEDLAKIQFLLEGDLMGEYFQEQTGVEFTSQVIIKRAELLNTTPVDLLKELIIYYQCDTAAYTEDAGGYRFLEHLFQYENGKKVFDKNYAMLRFSDRYWDLYLKLKNEL